MAAIVALVCAAALLSAQVALAQCKDCGQADRLCGPQCLLAVCQKCGVAATLEEVTALSGYDVKNGASMAGLHDGARAKGLDAVGMKIAVDELITLRMPAIAHVWGNHFVLVDGGMGDLVRVSEPPNEPALMAKDEFGKFYSGFALLVSKDKSLFPVPEAKGPDLRVGEYIWHFGVTEEGNRLEHVLTCKNEGNEDLVISKLESTCACTVALASEERLPAGASGQITVLFDTSGRKGVQQQTVYVHSNDPITPVVQLLVVGVVKSNRLLFSPRSIAFGEVRRGETASRDIFVPNPEARTIEIQSVSCDTPFVAAGIAERVDRTGSIISLSLAPDTPFGALKGTVTIYSDHPKDPKLEVPITATIKGDIEIFPDTLFFGILKKGSGGWKTAAISTAGDQPLAIEKIDNPLDFLIVRARPVAEGKSCKLTAALLRGAPVGYIKSEIVIHTNNPDQPEIKVPVYALVEE